MFYIGRLTKRNDDTNVVYDNGDSRATNEPVTDDEDDDGDVMFGSRCGWFADTVLFSIIIKKRTNGTGTTSSWRLCKPD